jgi:hypothetical protein
MRFALFHYGRTARTALGIARPATSYITRLTVTATFAYLLALLIPAGTDRPVLAPLTALLVLQASLYQTIHSAFRKVISVTAGVLIAVGVSEFVAFSWWQLALVIAAALLIGWMLRLGDDVLEVPISAMLIFSSAGTHVAATGRIVDTLVGTAAGLAGGLVFAKPRVQPAREAVGTLAGRLADLLNLMAGDLSAAVDASGLDAGQTLAPDPDGVLEWLTKARSLSDDLKQVDGTLRTAADSVRLNPRTRLGGVPHDLLAVNAGLRGGLETLEHATVTVRGLARSILDSTGIESCTSPVRDAQTRARLADVLRDLAEAIRTYGRLVQAFPAGSDSLKSELACQLETAHRQQDKLAAVLEPRTLAGGGSSEWSLRGEILAHVDLLRTGLRAEIVVHPAPSSGIRPHRARTVVRKPRGRPGAAKHDLARHGTAKRDSLKRDSLKRDTSKRDPANRDRNKRHKQRGKHQRDRHLPAPAVPGRRQGEPQARRKPGRRRPPPDRVRLAGHVADLAPERAVGFRRRAGRREDGDGRALHRHRLDDGQRGDHGARHIIAFR